MDSANSANGKFGGNTKPQISASKKWCFTHNNYTREILVQYVQCFAAKSLTFIIGEEVGEEGTPHLQGWIKSEKRFRPTELKLQFKWNAAHWEKCKGNDLSNIKYCSKDGKFQKSDDVRVPRALVKMSFERMRLYQRSIASKYDNPADEFSRSVDC